MVGPAMSLLANAAGIHSWFSGIRAGRIQESLLRETELTRHSIERLSDHILSVCSVVEVRSSTQENQEFLTDNRKICELLNPIQMSLGEDILTTAVVLTPDKLQNAMSKDPWEVLVEIRPVERVKRPVNPDMVPIIFNDGGGFYIGWQMRGTLPMLLGCEYEPENNLNAQDAEGKIWIKDNSGDDVLDAKGNLETDSDLGAGREISLDSRLKSDSGVNEEVGNSGTDEYFVPGANENAGSAAGGKISIGVDRKDLLVGMWNSGLLGRAALNMLQIASMGIVLIVTPAVGVAANESNYGSVVLIALFVSPFAYFLYSSSQAYKRAKKLKEAIPHSSEVQA